MSKCWFCNWGWPKPVLDIYLRAEKDLDELIESAWAETDYDFDKLLEPRNGHQALHYGPAHCIWDDENFDVTEKDKTIDYPWFSDWPLAVKEIVWRSIRELADLPIELRTAPTGYDGKNPDQFPPTHGVEMVPKNEVLKQTA